jgi:PAS domain S-box-containing protein
VKLFPLSRVDALHRWQKWVLVAVATGLYASVFLLFDSKMGPATAALSVLPVALVAWFFGPRIGLLAAFLSLPLNTILLNLVGASGWDASIRRGGLPGLLAIVGIAVVVGEIQDLSEKLRASEASARQLADASFEAIVIHDKGIVLEVNQSFCNMYGYKHSEVIGMSALQLTAPEDRQLVQQKIAVGEQPFVISRRTKRHGRRWKLNEILCRRSLRTCLTASTTKILKVVMSSSMIFWLEFMV